ncbi:endonuclease domain-containing protein [Flaviaesturariibacter amylovorans]|uniref:Endonuclease domain-containing protein n=1 Tax=Flaviaesturariibacter amylovorans TaxID=1084520 RepID=A0ABP8H4J4_9BACT
MKPEHPDRSYNRFGYQWADPRLYARLKERARQQLLFPTPAETLLWNELKGAQLEGWRFRRQHIIKVYIADFVCLPKNLVVEVDGLVHQLPEIQISDAERTVDLNSLGFTVIRFRNEEVEQDLPGVLARIRQKLKELPGIEKRRIND